MISGIPVRLRELVLSWLRAGIKSIWPLPENEGCPEHRYNEIVDKLHAGQRVSLLSTTLTRTVAKYFASLWGLDMTLCDAYANRLKPHCAATLHMYAAIAMAIFSKVKYL